MEEKFEEAYGELKRADHLIYVSLKYTRTGDVLLSILERFISALDKGMDLIYEIKDIKDIPVAPIPKANKLKEMFPDDEIINDMADFFIWLRKVRRSEFESFDEFRKGLRVVCSMPDGNETILDTETMKQYFDKTKEYFKYIKSMFTVTDD